ncbi:MAG: type I restriction enzyme HsdR N-terminal domain-containing protein [Planctomycetes bacterium]|nr:type I restriction enzyme HsdR N-terminal domain-containing protein [Planctomycetota bacterium]
MAGAPKRVVDRIKAALKQFVPVLQAQRDRDVSEADTVTLVKDLMSSMLGFDKYAELTSEHAIRGTYCDLAVKLDGKLRLLVEVKAIGIQLTDRHAKQAIDYAANQGVDWVVLTNSIQWRLYRVVFAKPIDAKLASEFDMLTVNVRSKDDVERLYLLSREGFQRSALQEYAERQAATSRFLVASLLLNDDDVVAVIRRELRKITDMLVDCHAIKQVLRHEVIKREALEGPEAADAERLVLRAAKAGRAVRANGDKAVAEVMAPESEQSEVSNP